MKHKWPALLFILFITAGIGIMFYHSIEMEKQEQLEEKREEVVKLLQYNLEQFDPTLQSFVDEEYMSVIASAVNSKGLCTFRRGLAKNQDPFGILTVEYDLVKMKVLSIELSISNDKYMDEWENFKDIK
ncbi:hypothetical protein ACFSCX_19645 [Bacillus salitolerans]|uniref:DUF1310 family protein n=1 Tax=Bacillus salitolerans TaxID=1437434 RepID=A0ABW4LUA6_9BACI